MPLKLSSFLPDGPADDAPVIEFADEMVSEVLEACVSGEHAIADF
jgi:hypothetical protein